MTPDSTAPPAAPPRPLKVTQLRVVNSEWTKLHSLRSTGWSALAAIVLTIGLGAAFSAGTAAHWTEMSPQDRLTFDATATSLAGAFLAQLAVGVLGVLVMSGEYATGQIRSTLGAVPRRLPVLWAKVAVFGVGTFVLSLITSGVAYLLGQRLLASTHVATTLGDPGVARAVLGAAKYLTVVGLLGLSLGTLLRNTAGAITALFGILVLPILALFLPHSWADHINKWLPSNAGQAIMQVRHDPASLSPWVGILVFAAYALVALILAAVTLVRRDA